jgi:cytochrome c553
MMTVFRIPFAVLLGLGLATPVAALEVPPHVKTIIIERCGLCHGPEGESASRIYPRLAAQHPTYMRKQLADFRDGRRKSEVMSEMTKDLKDEDFAVLADFYASKPAAAIQPGDPGLAAVGKYIYHKGNTYSGVPSCESCHGAQGLGTEQLPRLAGQHPRYLETQMQEFNQRARTNDNAIMHSIAAKLTELETRAVSVYIGGLQ